MPVAGAPLIVLFLQIKHLEPRTQLPPFPARIRTATERGFFLAYHLVILYIPT